MIKYYCDVCGKLIPKWKGSSYRIIRRLGVVAVEIAHSYKGTWNAGQVCAACIVKVVTLGKTDP